MLKIYSSDSCHLIKKSASKISLSLPLEVGISPPPLNAIWKTLHTGKVHSANNTTQELKLILLISTVFSLQVKYQEAIAMGMPVNNVFQ